MALFLLFLFGCTPKHETNHLGSERSPYLKKSQNDPIWWYPWGEQALDHAKKNDQLIFLSIGYSSCFACEKMNNEVENNLAVSKILNKYYVSIKVDREERPDLDAHFLNMQTAMMKFGAWPIHIFLTPNLKPLYATTYLPANKFTQVLTQLQKQWETEREKLIKNSDRFLQAIKPVEPTHPYYEKDKELIKDFYARYTHRFDTIYGGKSNNKRFTPKFPVNDEMRLLLRYHKQTGEKQPLKMVKKTLSTIAKSATFDQLEGGFHRYSSTRDWNTPNFEKMLFDQASYLNAFIDLIQVSHNDLNTSTIEKTLAFTLNHFQSLLGGFYSSMSGSINGSDGLYYTWQAHEVQSTLSKEEFKTFNEYFYLNPQKKQHNLRSSLRKKTSFNSSKLKPLIQKLLKARHKQVKPDIDTKVVTSHSAYFISALSRLLKIWPSEELEKITQKNLDYLLNQHRNLKGFLLRRSEKGETKFLATLDDYAFLIDSLIEFYQVSFDKKYLDLALDLQEKQNNLFYNNEKNLFRFSQGPEGFLKDQYLFMDQVTPSGQSMSYWNLLRLARFFNNSEFDKMADNIIDAYPDQLKSDPISYAHLLLALDFNISNAKLLEIGGPRKACQKYSRELYKDYFPYLLIQCRSGKSNSSKSLKDVSFKVCEKTSCYPITQDFLEAKKLIYSQ